MEGVHGAALVTVDELTGRPALAVQDGGQGLAWSGGASVQARDSQFYVRWGRADDVLVRTAEDGRTEIALNQERPTLLLLHGAGQSSLSWTTTVMSFRTIESRCLHDHINVIAYDARGHGQTNGPEEPERLCKDELVKDCLGLLQALHGDKTRPLEVFLVGHSMGGAIATWAATALAQSPSQVPGVVVKGLFLMDIVEETAMRGLEGTRRYLEQRPRGFSSEEEAVKWALGSGMLHHPESALYSVSGQVRRALGDNTAKDPPKGQNESCAFVWRAALVECFSQWAGWFTGLSEAFVNLKLLNKTILLAGMDSLDKTMIVGQMQGKFKLIVFPEVRVGHFVHEDAPDRTAAALDLFCHRSFALPAHLQRANAALATSADALHMHDVA